MHFVTAVSIAALAGAVSALDIYCPNGYEAGGPGSLQKCINQIRDLGNQQCVVDSNGGNYPAKFCDEDGAQVLGFVNNGVSATYSSCSDIAAGAQAVFDTCKYYGGIMGTGPAAGNGDLKVQLQY